LANLTFGQERANKLNQLVEVTSISKDESGTVHLPSIF